LARDRWDVRGGLDYIGTRTLQREAEGGQLGVLVLGQDLLTHLWRQCGEKIRV
jgi:hypothetical protein